MTCPSSYPNQQGCNCSNHNAILHELSSTPSISLSHALFTATMAPTTSEPTLCFHSNSKSQDQFTNLGFNHNSFQASATPMSSQSPSPASSGVRHHPRASLLNPIHLSPDRAHPHHRRSSIEQCPAAAPLLRRTTVPRCCSKAIRRCNPGRRCESQSELTVNPASSLPPCAQTSRPAPASRRAAVSCPATPHRLL